MLTTVVKPDTYQDSVSLMLLSQQLSSLPGVNKVSVMMGTPANKDILRATGFASPELNTARAGDLVLAVDVEGAIDAAGLVTKATEVLSDQARRSTESGLRLAHTLDRALEMVPDANLALVSIPGEHVADQVDELLERDLNVMIFSDNVSVDDEVRLKESARRRGLLLMGPDCGTAAIGGVPLAFANVVRAGDIGIVGASGTGTQEVMSQIDELGGGVSNVIGLGGRDLDDEVGGATCLQAMTALENDPLTSVIVIVSKPPAPAVRERIETYAQRLTKRVVAVFIGKRPPVEQQGNITFAYTLADAAARAVELAGRGRPTFGLTQRWIKGMYTGGTLADEAAMLIRDVLDLKDDDPSHPQGYVLHHEGHQIVDLGDDTYTRGRPHPMIDPTARTDRLPAVFDDEGTAVVLLDTVIGFGATEDPAGALAAAIVDGIARAASAGRQVAVVASVCGTSRDLQGLETQRSKLLDAGVTVLPNNAAAVRHALALIAEPVQRGGAVEKQPTPPRIAQLLENGPTVINIGVRAFAETLSSLGVNTAQYDWSPPAAGDPRLAGLVRALDNL
jgi:FdrA protein